MFRRLLLLLLIWPLVELYGLFLLAQYTSAQVAIIWVLVAGLCGVLLIRWQHFRTWRLASEELAASRLPAAALFDGALFVLAGLLLILPGVLSDVCAVALLLPPVRHALRRYARRRLERRFVVRGDGAGIHRDEIIESRVIEAQPKERSDNGA